MAKKAKLDILEVSIDQKIEETPPPSEESQSLEEDAPVEQPLSESRIGKLKVWVRVHLPWLVVIFVILIALIAAGVFLWYHSTAEVKAPVVDLPKTEVAPVIPPVKNEIVPLEGFVIDQRDDKANMRLAYCDIAVELGNPELAKSLGERIDVREVIYAALKRIKAEDGFSLEKRNLLKEEIKSDLNGLLGEKAVSRVYITNYELN